MSERHRFYPNRMKWVVAALTCAVMTAGGLWIIADGSWFGYIATAFFGLGLIVSLILLLPNSSFLELDASGFLIRNLFRDSRLSWADVDSFEARRVGVRKMVTLKFAPEYNTLPRARAAARIVSGAEGALPDTYGRSAEDLARMMNEHVLMYRASLTPDSAT